MDERVNYSQVLLGRVSFTAWFYPQEIIIISSKGQRNGIFLGADHGILISLTITDRALPLWHCISIHSFNKHLLGTCSAWIKKETCNFLPPDPKFQSGHLDYSDLSYTMSGFMLGLLHMLMILPSFFSYWLLFCALEPNVPLFFSKSQEYDIETAQIQPLLFLLLMLFLPL